jgi:putative membrane protein
MGFVIHLLVTSLLILLVAKLVTGFEVDSWGSALLAALILGLVNAVIRPVVVFLSLPLTILTLGLFIFVINALMVWLASAIGPGFRIKGFGPAFLGALLLTLFNWLIGAFFL